MLVKFKVGDDVQLGDRTEAAIKTKGLLGSKVLDVTPRGGGQLTGPHPHRADGVALPTARYVGRLSHHGQRLNTDQLSNSLMTLAQTFANTPPDLRNAVQGGGEICANTRRARRAIAQPARQRRQSDRCAAKRTDKVVSLIRDTNALLAQLRTQSSALDQIWTNISAVSRQLKGLHRRKPPAATASAGQAQRRPSGRRQPQRASTAVHQAA